MFKSTRYVNNKMTDEVVELKVNACGNFTTGSLIANSLIRLLRENANIQLKCPYKKVNEANFDVIVNCTKY